jgi:hypothetical protein
MKKDDLWISVAPYEDTDFLGVLDFDEFSTNVGYRCWWQPQFFRNLDERGEFRVLDHRDCPSYVVCLLARGGRRRLLRPGRLMGYSTAVIVVVRCGVTTSSDK